MHSNAAELLAVSHKGVVMYPTLGLTLDFSGANVRLAGLEDQLGPKLRQAVTSMQLLESGGIANPDEKRMVGHYWLRNPKLAPSPEIRNEIETTVREVESFADKVRSGEICGQGGRFKNFLLIGIGGSALGPQLVTHAFKDSYDRKLEAFFIDNTDPDGIARIYNDIGNEISKTLCIVVSKSGKTRETHNGMVFSQNMYERAGLSFAKHAVAITVVGSRLDRYARENGWLARFPIWEWVGGRTSFCSAVSLLPAALSGVPIREILAGAKMCDELTRSPSLDRNPALQLAATWFRLAETEQKHCVAIIPYKDAFEYLSKYFQQLIMESLGKEKDLQGHVVNKGLVVFGNKGSTDQHSYVQQLRDGLDNAFTIFITVAKNGRDELVGRDGITLGDYLQGFAKGTARALQEKARRSITISLYDVSPFSLGVIVALFERSVGFYASLANINAYHQPGVEAGKVAAEEIVKLKTKVLEAFQGNRMKPITVSELAGLVDYEGRPMELAWLCDYLAANERFGIRKIWDRNCAENRYYSL